MVKYLPTMLKVLRWISCNREKTEKLSSLLLTEEKDRDEYVGMEDRKLNGRKRHTSSCSLRTHRTMENRLRSLQRVWQMVQNPQLNMTTYASIHYQQNFHD